MLGVLKFLKEASLLQFSIQYIQSLTLLLMGSRRSLLLQLADCVKCLEFLEVGHLKFAISRFTWLDHRVVGHVLILQLPEPFVS